ncbi:hypothetical protein HYC85_001666 [Camellia sinensis]|uniref:Alcohol dehydrogenase-like C-terminal domain-containing protein n=1 Tax=Camellia sinensis TaxID=4442 RepID=A0A7J7I7A6_CAMSI|nr:hypothetical protein HYC85_001666 [Camellia sinensis]
MLHSLGVIGLGGLGHVAVKFAKAFGVKVTVISTSPGKKEEAMKHLGADLFLVSKDADQMQVIYVQIDGLFVKAAMGTMDGIIDTVSSIHPVMPLIGLLKTQGKLVMVGAPDKPLELPVFPLLTGKHYEIFYHQRLYTSEKLEPLSWDLRIQIAVDVARALEYLLDGVA